LPGFIGARTFMLIDSPILNKFMQKKLFLERVSRLLSLYKKFDANSEESLWAFIAFVVGSTFRENELNIKWMHKVISSIIYYIPLK
jgi:hypothetical protein